LLVHAKDKNDDAVGNYLAEHSTKSLADKLPAR
jgi:hypothetical protein